MPVRGLKLFAGIQPRTSLHLLQNLAPLFNTTRNSSSRKESFLYEDLIVDYAKVEQLNPKPELSALKFGHCYTDHMFEVEWSESNGWGTPRISPLHTLELHPGSKVLHYAQSVFEGMKAFRHTNGRIALFRPDMNLKRLQVTSQRACLPAFDGKELLKCIKKLISIDQDWVPSQELYSLYVRPNFIGTESTLGVAASKKALLYVICGPTGPYFKSTIEPISLYADPNYVRAPPGGVGCFKMASNYAPTLYVQKIAQQQQMDQVLWLLGKDHQITEAGAMNVFFVLKDSKGEIELVTPSLDGTILPGIVRQSVLDLARNLNEFTVSERTITMNEVICARKDGRLLEMFVCGTALVVCPVNSIRFKGEDIKIPTLERDNPLCNRFLKMITDIQHGRVKSDWSVFLGD